MDKLCEARNIINETDMQMARLFEQRMKAVKIVAEYKTENNIPVFDPKREQEVILRNTGYISDGEIAGYYEAFIKDVMEVSKQYQTDIINKHNSEGEK